MQFARLDRQNGTDGEHWRIAALTDAVTRSRFESMSVLAGRKLLETPYQPPEVLSATTDLTRWFRRLAFNSPNYEFGPFGHLRDDNGMNVGWISTGSIQRPAAVASAMCLELQTMMNEKSQTTAAGITINLSGQNSRLNVGSHDQSTNIASSSSTSQLFQELRQAVEAGLSGEERTSLLERVAALEASLGKPSFLTEYKELMQAAANHATIIAPFLPALAGLLG